MKSRVDLGLEKKFSIVAALFFGVSLASFVAIRGYVYADSTTSASASVVVPDVCSISSTTTGHNATVAVGTSRTDIGTTDISVICNDNDGFSVYATGYSNDTVGNTNLIGVVSGLAIPTGTSSDASVSNWSMKISPVTGNYTPTVLSDANGSYASYHIIPSTTTKVVTRTSAINVSSASEFRTTYAVAVAPAQTADTYVGKVKYTVVHPNYSNVDGSLESYPVNLSFGVNTSSIVIDGVTYTSSSAAPELEYGTHTISATFPSGYELDSWSTTGNVSIASSTSNPTTITVTGEGTVTVTSKSSKLYFQNATSAQCGQTMYDNRGTDAYKNIAYTTATINNLCWMTRNLDLPGGTTLTSSDSNVASDYTLPASSTSGFSSDSTAYVYNSNSTTCGSGQPCYSYYSYVAATAGTNPSSGNATSDICPKGWRLPIRAELDTLKNTYTTGATLTASPFNGVYAGGYYNSSFGNGGSFGYYWSSTTSDDPYAYFLYFSSGGMTGTQIKRFGHSIRCILETRTLSDLTYMQDINNIIVNNTTEGTVAALTDRRDGTTYHVGKLADGRVWMLDNLALDLTTVSLSNLQGNTNASYTALNYLKNGGGTTTDQYPTAGVTTFTSVNNYSIPNMISSGTCYDSNCVNDPTTGNWTKDSVLPYSIGAIPNSRGYNKIGIYYNYCAASAGTYCWGNGTSSAGSPTTDPNSGTLLDIQEDICPLGWRMPTSNNGGEYQALYSAYSSNYTDFRRALSTPLSGYYNNGSARVQSGDGRFWSSTWNSTYGMRHLRMNTSNIYPSNVSVRYDGFSVRCIVK